MDVENLCDFCEERNCALCSIGNPCLGCEDYKEGKCTSNGGCGTEKQENFALSHNS